MRGLFLAFLLLMSAVAGATLAACSPARPGVEAQPELTESVARTATPPAVQTVFPTEEIVRGVVSIRHAWDETRLPTLAAIIKTFQSYHPDVMFDVLYVPVDTLADRFALESSEGLAPTLVFGPAEWGPGFYQAGLISDLSGEIDPVKLEMLNPAALEAARASQFAAGDTALIGLPYAIQGVLLYRNQSIITLAPNTFEELVTLAQSSTQGATVGAYLERSFYYSGAHLYGMGGQLIDSNQLPGFNNGQGVAWLQLLKDMELAGPTSFFSDDDLERFKLGAIGWIIDGSWNLRNLVEAIGAENLAVDPWPRYQDGRLSGFVRAENAYLSAQASPEDRRAAVVFLEYLISPESQSLLADSGSFPANQVFNPTVPVYGRLMTQVSRALADGTAYPLDPNIAVYSLNFDLALRAFFEQNLPPEQVLQSAQDAILEEIQP